MSLTPQPIDPRDLAAEIEATVSEFNRLSNLAASVHVSVFAEVHTQRSPGEPQRAVLMVQVVAP